MKIISAIVDIENDIIVLRSEHFEFNSSKELPQRTREIMKKINCVNCVIVGKKDIIQRRVNKW